MKKEEINKLYEEKALGFFPFISKSRVTILEKGYYTKKKANYRGISYIYDKYEEKYKTLLLGYFYVPDNYVIVPNEDELTEGKEILVKRYLDKGFIKIDKCPSLKPITFEENSPEYQAALQSHNKHKNS